MRRSRALVLASLSVVCVLLLAGAATGHIGAAGQVVRAIAAQLTDPPNAAQTTTAVMAPLESAPDYTITDSAATTPVAPFSDLGADDQNASVVQLFAVRVEDDETQRVCGKLFAVGTACTGSSLTCDGTSTDGTWVFPGQTQTFRGDGTLHLCVAAEAASVLYQVERVARRGR